MFAVFFIGGAAVAVGEVVLTLGYPAWHARLGFAATDSVEKTLDSTR
jgi:hypothetical protein